MARPKDPAADYTGGTPTAAYNRDPGWDYTGGTPTAGYDNGMRATREEDYTNEDVLSGRRQKYLDTAGKAEILRKYAALGQVTPEQQANAARSRLGGQWLVDYNIKQAYKLDTEWARVSGQVDPRSNPVIHDIVVEANKSGANLTDQDIANLVTVGDHERALHAYSDFMQKGDVVGARNMILGLQKSNPILASLVPASFEKQAGKWISESGGKWVADQARDPNLVQNALGTVGGWLTSESNWNPIHDLTLAWEGTQHAIAASKVGDQQETVSGVFTNPLTYVPILGPVLKGWEATEKGSLDPKRLEEIKSTYPAPVVDAALKMRQAFADGDASVVTDMLMDENLDPQVANFVRDTIYSGTETATMLGKDGKEVPLGSRDLMQQILGARTDNIGDIVTTDFLQAWNRDFNASNGYGSPLRGAISSGTNLAASFIDPTILVTGAGRLVIASRYAIAKLAPKVAATASEAERAAARADIGTALRSVKVAGFETNRARRYMEGFLREADRLDELEKGSVKYALQRERIARQYRLIPDDVAETFINDTSKTSVGRQIEGIVVDGERVSTGLVDVIADQNELWVGLSQGVSKKAADAGRDYLMNKAIALKLLDDLDEGVVPLEKLKTMSMQEIEDLYTSKLGEFKARAEVAAEKAAASGTYSEKANDLGSAATKAADEYMQVRDAVGKAKVMEEAIVGRELADPISARLTSRTQSRDLLMPRTGVVGDLRRRAVNSIFTSGLGAKRAQALVDVYLNGALTPDAVAQAVENNFDKFGRAQRTMRGSDMLPGRLGAVADRVSRLGSTMPSKTTLNIATAADANEFYKFARQYHSKPVSTLLTDAFRRGDEGTRRNLIAATIRSGAASRGVDLSKAEIATKLDELATGRYKGEAYAMETPGAPSAIMMESTRREAEKADRLVAKSESVIAKRSATIEKAKADLEKATASGDLFAVEAAQKRIDNALNSIAKHEAKIAKQQIHFDRLENALLLSLGKKQALRPSKLEAEIPVAIAEAPAIPESVVGGEVQAANDARLMAEQLGQPELAILNNSDARELLSQMSDAVEAKNVTDAAILESEIQKHIDEATSSWAAQSIADPKIRTAYLDSLGLGETPSDEWITKFKLKYDEASPNTADLSEGLSEDTLSMGLVGRRDDFLELDEDFANAVDAGDAAKAEYAAQIATHRWRSQVSGTPDLWKKFLAEQGIDYDAPIPDTEIARIGGMFDQVGNTSAGSGIRSSAGADMDVEDIAVARWGKKNKNGTQTETPQWKRWQKHGAISQRELADMYDRFGSEGVWNWWNTGKTEADPAEIFAQYGPAPALKGEFGPDGKALTTYDRIPDEYLGQGFNLGKQRGLFMKVPWKKTKNERADFIESSYFSDLGDAEDALRSDMTRGEYDDQLENFMARMSMSMNDLRNRNAYVEKQVASAREEVIESAAQGADTKLFETFAKKIDDQSAKAHEFEQKAADATADKSMQSAGSKVLDDVPTYDELTGDARRTGSVHDAFAAEMTDADGQFSISVSKPRGLYDGDPEIYISWHPNWHKTPFGDPNYKANSTKWKAWQKENNAEMGSMVIKMDGTLVYDKSKLPAEIFNKMLNFAKEQFATVERGAGQKTDNLFLAELKQQTGARLTKLTPVDGYAGRYLVFDDKLDYGLDDQYGVLRAMKDAGYSYEEVNKLRMSLPQSGPLPDELKQVAEAWRTGNTPQPAVVKAAVPEAPVADESAQVFDQATGMTVDPGYTMGDINAMVGDYVNTINDPIKAANGTIQWSPSKDLAGRENGIHLYQMAKNVSIPSMRDIEAIGELRQLRAGRFATGLAQGTTDWWSLGTLYGYRFAQRSALEDLISFALTSGLGRTPDLLRGRRASTAIRDVNPTIKVVKKTDMKDGGIGVVENARRDLRRAENRLAKARAAGDEEAISQAESAIRTAKATIDNDYVYIVPKNDPNLFFDRTSRLGMFNKWFRRMGDYAQAKNLQFLQSVVLPNIDVEKLAVAHAATTHGNYAPIRELIGETLASQRFNKMSADDIEYVKDLMGTPAGTAIFQDFAESAAKANSANFAGMGHAADELLDIPDIEFAKPGKGVYYGPYKSLRLSAKVNGGGMEDGAMTAWYRRLQAIVDDDGPIGKIAVAHLNNPEKAKKAIADAIRKDALKKEGSKGKWGYAERWSLVGNEAAIDDFASRYYESVLPYFLKRDNTLNWDLRNTFVHSYIDKKGNPRFKVAWTVSDDQGRNRFVLPFNDLSAIRPKDRPLYVLGREQSTIPMPKNEKALVTDRAWDWMGEQYARIAREPIFMANYFANRRALKPMQDQLAQVIAGEGKAISRTDELVARRLVDRQAHDAAYSFSLSYMDNPNNRSILAYKVRNFARYYRATEDFYRRAGRLAKNYPDAYWKLALTYQVLDDTGWTYRDENGDLYFAYPGNQFLQDAIATISGPLLGGNFGLMNAVDPFQIGGKLKSIAPSTDPSQWLITPSGPIGTLPLTLLFNKFPEMQGIRALTLGEYSQAGQTGNLAGEILDTILPGGAQRMWNNLGPDERDASIAGAMHGAMAISMANGVFDNVNPNEMTIEQLKNNDVYGEVSKSAWSTLITKMFLGYASPASPQMYQNSVTEFGRDLGISGMSQLWRQLIDKHEGDFVAAFSDWQKIDSTGDLLPFTVSKTKDNPDLLASLTKAKPYQQVVEWTRTGEAKELSSKFPDSYMFLAPQSGDFTWDGWALLKGLGLKVGKDTNAIVIDMFAARGEREDAAIRAMYDAEIAKYDRNTEEGRKEIRRLEGEKSDARSDVEKKNPYWRAKRDEIRQPYMGSRIVTQFNETIQMLDYLQTKNGELSGTAALISVANSVWLDYNTQKAGFSSTTDAGQQSRRDLTSQMEAELAGIGAQDPAVSSYIETILMNLDYGSL